MILLWERYLVEKLKNSIQGVISLWYWGAREAMSLWAQNGLHLPYFPVTIAWSMMIKLAYPFILQTLNKVEGTTKFIYMLYRLNQNAYLQHCHKLNKN